jgi:biopolymer transport protein ExbB/TolQ
MVPIYLKCTEFFKIIVAIRKFKKKRWSNKMLSKEIQFSFKRIHRLKMEGWKRMLHEMGMKNEQKGYTHK